MKKLQFLSVLLFFIISCKKSGEKTVEPIDSSLIGQWTYTEYYFSPGAGPIEWQPVTPPGQTIEFKSDGTFVPCESLLKDADHFEILDSVTVKFRPGNNYGANVMTYSIDTIAGELLMVPVPACIEGCAYKLKR